MSNAFVTVTIDGVVYDNIVPKNYRMDVRVEDLLYADDLRNDMVVLIGDVGERQDETNVDDPSPLLIYRNRWASVKRLRHEPSGIYFILQYSDGDMIIRQTVPTSGWIVKRSSIVVTPQRQIEGSEEMPAINSFRMREE